MKKFINKKNMKKFIVLTAIIGVGILGINYTFCYPTKINAYIAANVYSQPANSYFDDDNFYQCVVDAYNKKNVTNIAYTENLTDDELQTIDELNCSRKGIISTKGIEKLISLKYLDITYNRLTSIDVSNNIKLSWLILYENELTSIDVSKNTELTRIDVMDNQITQLDVSKNTKLKSLSVIRNQLTNLDVSNNLNLTYLSVHDNKLTDLNIKGATALTRLSIAKNQLTELDVSNNTELTEIEVYENNLTELDVSKNTKLTRLNVYKNLLTFLDVSNNKALKKLNANNNILIELNTNGATALEKLIISENQLTEVDLSNNIALTDLYVAGNLLTELDVKNNSNLKTLDVGYYTYDYDIGSGGGGRDNASNKISKLDVSNNSELLGLYVNNNKLTELDISNNSKLQTLYATNNQLTELNTNGATALETIIIDENLFTTLDVSNNKALTFLDVANNRLNKLDVSNNINLKDLYLCNNRLTELNINGATALEKLIITGNKLTTIDLSNNTKLTEFYAANNLLTELDVKQNNNLKILDVGYWCFHDRAGRGGCEIGNNISSIDLSENKLLEKLYINNNPYNENLYVYKGNEVIIGNNVKIPSHLNWSSPKWTYDDSDIIKLNNENNISTIDIGNAEVTGNVKDKYTTTSIINVVEITSDKYLINEENNYIYIGTDNEIGTIMNNINKSNNNIELDVDLEKYKLLVKYESIILKEFDLIYVSSNVYNIANNYIYVGTNELDLNDISIANGTLEVKDNKLLIKYDDEVLIEYKLINILSDTYDLSNDYIYIGTDELDLNDISVVNGISEIKDNKLLIKYNDDVLGEFKLVSVASENYDLSKDYIYIGTDELDLNDISVVNGISEIKDNKLLIKYEDDVLGEFKLVSFNSKLKIIDKYIYVSNLNEEKILSQVTIINGNCYIENDKLKVKYNDIVLDEYSFIKITLNELVLLDNNKLYISNYVLADIKNKLNVINAELFIYEDKIEIIRENIVLDTFRLLTVNLGNLKETNKNIIVSKNVEYNEFVNNIVVSDWLTYKLFNNNEEITSGNVEKDMVLKVYYNDEEIDLFTITDEYLVIDESISVNSDNMYFNNIDFNTTVDMILNKIDTTAEVTIKNKDNEVITGNDLIGTGSIVSIKLSKETYNYTVIVHGDVDGDGVLKLSDIMKIANYTYKNKNSLTGVFELAADFDNNGTHNLQDIMKSAKALYGGK